MLSEKNLLNEKNTLKENETMKKENILKVLCKNPLESAYVVTGDSPLD